eukprot:CAMPEP_0197494828 /NCGR_PEP_ID=MMETSP1311-20131121/32554_1 /TAXON_ID=464262 /ORGANISM="Genus nov. species nov., Strain RCC856" /LENGTH=132 /DNA_ID=CAMNT_0043040271 /DNA_START=66 /DNA_END=464 /DNA_ORIENTATION=-
MPENPFVARARLGLEPAGQGESHEERVAVCEAFVEDSHAYSRSTTPTGGAAFSPKVLFTPFGKIMRTRSGDVVSRKSTLTTFGVSAYSDSPRAQRCCSLESFAHQPRAQFALLALSGFCILATATVAIVSII